MIILDHDRKELLTLFAIHTVDLISLFIRQEFLALELLALDERLLSKATENVYYRQQL